MIALALVITLCAVASVTDNTPKELIGIVSIIIGYYFGARTVTK